MWKGFKMTLEDALSFDELLDKEVERMTHSGEFPVLGAEVQATINIAKEMLGDNESLSDVIFEMWELPKGTIYYTGEGHPYNYRTVIDCCLNLVNILKAIGAAEKQILTLFKESELNNIIKGKDYSERILKL